MKYLFGCLLAVFLSSPASFGAPALGPDVAVFQLRFGRDKQTHRVVIALYDTDAPRTVENFKTLIKKKFYNGLQFHRIFKGILVQTGDPSSRHGQGDRTGTGGPGYTIPAEIRLTHNRGSVATARLPDDVNPAKNSNGSQFYVCLTPLPKLDGQYTVFGEVIEGLEVLDNLSKVSTNSNDFPLLRVTINSTKLESRLAPPTKAR